MIARLPLPSEGQWLSDDLVGQGQGKSPEEGPSRQTPIAVRLLSKIDLRRPRDGHGITKGLPGEVARPELPYALPDSMVLTRSSQRTLHLRSDSDPCEKVWRSFAFYSCVLSRR